MEKQGGFRFALTGGCWPGEGGGGLTRSGASYVIGLRAYLTFSVGYELDVG